MKKILLLVFAVVLISLTLAFEATALFPGEYHTFTYGEAFRLQESVADSNGNLDTDFSSTCTLTGKYEPTQTLVLDHNAMLQDPNITALYYLIIDANITDLWPKGKYNVIMTCQDSTNDLNGSQTMNFIIDQNVSQYFQDLNNSILDVNSTTLDQILRTVSDINETVTPEYLSNAFDDDLNLYSDITVSSLAHGLSFQPFTVLYYRGTASTGTIPNTTNFSSVTTIFCTAQKICFNAEQVSSPIVVDGNLTGSINIPNVSPGDYNFFLVVSGDDDTGTNVTVNGSTQSITIERYVPGSSVGIDTPVEEWQRLIDSGEIKLTKQIIDSGLASESQIDFYERSQPNAFWNFLLTPTRQSNFVPPAIFLGLIALVGGASLSQTRFFVLGLFALFTGLLLIFLPVLV